MVSINTSSTQLNLLHQSQRTSAQEANQLKKLSTGKKVNSAADDVTAINKIASLSSAISGTGVGSANASQAASTINVAAGGLSQVLGQLQQLRSTAVQAADGALSASDRSNLTNQASNTVASINQIANTIQADGNKLLNGSFGNRPVQVGPSVGDVIEMNIEGARAADMGVDNLDLSTPAGANSAITAIDSAITQVTGQLSSLGSTQTRLESAVTTNQLTTENLSDSLSRIQDTDLGETLSELKNLQIKKEAGVQISKLLQQSQKQTVKLLT